MQLDLRLPNISQPLRPLFASTDRTVLIAAARIDGPRTALMWWLLREAFSTPLANQNFVWMTPNPDRARSMMERALVQSPHLRKLWTAAKANRPDILGRNQSQMYFMSPRHLETFDLPVVHSVVLDEAQSIPNPGPWCAQYVSNYVRALGYPTIDENWFSAEVSKSTPSVTVLRVSIDDELAAGTINATTYNRIKAEIGEDRFKSEYLLESRKADAGWTGKGLDQFIHDRLFILTDRDPQLLTDRQRQHVQQQTGDALEHEQHGQYLVPFDLTLLQRRYLDIKRRAMSQGKRRRFILLKARQSGFSTLEQAENYYVTATQARSKVVTLAHTDESTTRIFAIAKTFYDNDPFKTPRKHDNARSIKLRGLDSEFFIGTAGAKSYGRGFTLQRVHCSEVAMWGSGNNRVEQVSAIIEGSLLPASRNGTVVLESTANGVEWFCETYREAKLGKNDWTPIFLPWFTDPLNVAAPGTYNPEEIRDTLLAEELELITRVQQEYDISIGLDAIAFRRHQQREVRRLFAQEYPEDDESCFFTSGTPFFSLQRIQYLIKFWEKNYAPDNPTKKKGFDWHIWEKPIPGRKYSLGADTSEGLPTSDPCGVGVMDTETGEQVAEVHGRGAAWAQADVINELHRYYNRALIGVERNNHGHAILQVLKEKYHHKGMSEGGYLYESNGRPGWDTNESTRGQMIASLDAALTFRDTGWRDRGLLEECRTFKLQKDGKYEADPGAHDDRVVKWAICEMMRKQKQPKPSIHYQEL